MNDKLTKTKKHSNVYSRQYDQLHLDKNPSASSFKHLQGHCLPKEPPNIAAYHHYAHPRKYEHKENIRSRENNHHPPTREAVKYKNVLLQPRKSNLGEEGSRRTQKKMKKGTIRSEWVSPEDDGLGCHEHLSSQIFRQSGRSSVSKTKKGNPVFIKHRLYRTPTHNCLRVIESFLKENSIHPVERRTRLFKLTCKVVRRVCESTSLC